MIVWGQLADSIGATVRYSLGPRAPNAETRYLSPQLRYRAYPDPFPHDLRQEALSVVDAPASIGLEPVRQLTQTLGAIPTGVAHRLPGFDRGLLERAAAAQRQYQGSDTVPIAGCANQAPNSGHASAT
jgi:hypothetical protein